MLLQAWTSLHCAIFSGNAQIARALLAHGADANIVFPECKDDNSAPQARFSTAFAHQSYNLAATASVAYRPSSCSVRCCNNNIHLTIPECQCMTHISHDIVAVSHAAYHSCAAGTRGAVEFVSVQGSLLYQSAKVGRLMCVKALLASGASTAFQYKVQIPQLVGRTAVVPTQVVALIVMLHHFRVHRLLQCWCTGYFSC